MILHAEHLKAVDTGDDPIGAICATCSTWDSESSIYSTESEGLALYPDQSIVDLDVAR